jgi:radical SAM family uncharacterized protein
LHEESNDSGPASPEVWPQDELEGLLARVARPGRYVGGEFNLRHKPAAGARVVLSYPDAYEVGISNPALQILYALIAEETPAVVERAYCPLPDMADLMRAEAVPLWALESLEPVSACDLWAFTLPHELTYTNVLEMLDLAGVPLRTGDRRDGDPIVIGGGPAVANPWPLAGFFDAFFIGEVEGRIGELVGALGAPARAERLARLGRVPGVWLPHAPQALPVERQVFMDFARTPPVTVPLVPLLEAVHDRVVIEVMRGCTAGCRFCQAGMWYRPVRERPVDMVVAAAERALAATGCDEVSLISLSSCDYGGIDEAVRRIRDLRPGLRVSLPSLRIDSAATSLAAFAAEQRGSVTLAPEAGTQELRDRINKGVDEEQFEDAVHAVFEGGFTGLKLYFMIGLPGEEDHDVRAIADMVGAAARLAKRVARGRARLSVAVSSYVPKPHTPFELEPFAGEDVLRRRQSLLRTALPRHVHVAFHDVASSTVEATLARGGPGSDLLVEQAWRLGARFDGWREHFAADRWRESAAAFGLRPGEPAGEWRSFERPAQTDAVGAPGAQIGTDAAAWHRVVDARIEPAFLAQERRRATERALTDDCRGGRCESCGVCGAGIEMELLG